MGLGSSFGITSETNNNIQTDGLVGYWDAAYKSSYPRSGTVWTDLAGSNNGTLSADAIGTDVPGSMDFNGSDEYVTTDLDPPSGNSTYSGWGYWTDTAGTPGWDAIFNSGDSTLYLWFGRNNTRGIFVHHHNANNYYSSEKTGDNVLADNTWYNIVFTWDGSDIIIYNNGSVVASTTNGTMQNIDQDSGIWFGRYSGDYHKGRVALLQVYNRALSAAEIKQNYNAQKQRFGF